MKVHFSKKFGKFVTISMVVVVFAISYHSAIESYLHGDSSFLYRNLEDTDGTPFPDVVICPIETKQTFKEKRIFQKYYKHGKDFRNYNKSELVRIVDDITRNNDKYWFTLQDIDLSCYVLQTNQNHSLRVCDINKNDTYPDQLGIFDKVSTNIKEIITLQGRCFQMQVEANTTTSPDDGLKILLNPNLTYEVSFHPSNFPYPIFSPNKKVILQNSQRIDLTMLRKKISLVPEKGKFGWYNKQCFDEQNSSNWSNRIVKNFMEIQNISCIPIRTLNILTTEKLPPCNTTEQEVLLLEKPLYTDNLQKLCNCGEHCLKMCTKILGKD